MSFITEHSPCAVIGSLMGFFLSRNRPQLLSATRNQTPYLPPYSVATLPLQQRPVLLAAAAPRTRTPGSSLQRRETTMTPDGRQRPPRGIAGEGPHSAPQVSKQRGLQHQDDLRVTRRRSLAFTIAEPVRTISKPAGATVLAPTSRARAGAGVGNSDNPGVSTSTVTGEAGLTVSTRNRLEQFRCVRGPKDLS